MENSTLKERSLTRYSWEYEHFPEPDQWFLLARAYIDCSHHLLEEMIQERLNSSFHHAKVVVATFEQAIELFLKGALNQARRAVPNHHRLKDLLKEYQFLYPEKKYQFFGKIDEVVSENASTPHNQYARYPRDRKGRPWQGATNIDLSIWYRELRPFKADFDRLEPLIKARYPRRTDEENHSGT